MASSLAATRETHLQHESSTPSAIRSPVKKKRVLDLQPSPSYSSKCFVVDQREHLPEKPLPPRSPAHDSASGRKEEKGDSCAHPAFFAGLCVVCGLDVDQQHVRSIENESGEGDEKAGTHDTITVRSRTLGGGRHDAVLRVTLSHAKKVASEHFVRMIDGGKLALVLDLDHTLVHSIDARSTDVGETMSTISRENKYCPYLRQQHLVPSSPDVHQLSDRRTLTVLRPGVKSFLNRMRAVFEIHLYTMGHKEYALEVASLLDPQGRLFSSVVTRDDCNVPGQKNLDVLMIDPRICVILDDIVDVWHEDDRECVVPVKPFFAFYKTHPVRNRTDSEKYYYRKHWADSYTDLLDKIPARLEHVRSIFYESFGKRACDTRNILTLRHNNSATTTTTITATSEQQQKQEEEETGYSSSSSSSSSLPTTETEEEIENYFRFE